MHDRKLEDVSNTEIQKLRDYFDANQIEYELRNWEEGRFNIHVDLEYIYLSFLTSVGSYGGREGLIEYYNFRDEPTGYLTADGAIEIYKKAVDAFDKGYLDLDDVQEVLMTENKIGFM